MCVGLCGGGNGRHRVSGGVVRVTVRPIAIHLARV